MTSDTILNTNELLKKNCVWWISARKFSDHPSGKILWVLSQIFFYKKITFEVIFMYFKRVFRLFWQSYSQTVALLWPLPQSCTGAMAPAPNPPWIRPGAWLIDSLTYRMVYLGGRILENSVTWNLHYGGMYNILD